MYKLLILLLTLFVVACNNEGGAGAPVASVDAAMVEGDNAAAGDEPYAYLNALRADAGMTALLRDEQLAVASLNHARYLDINNVLGHQEVSGNSGFTGVYVPERIAAVGYHTRWAGEVIADGQSAVDAVDLLMSAIYHRLALLDFTMDRTGISFFDSQQGADFLVASFSNSALNVLCQTPITSDAMISGQCSPDTALSRPAFEQARTAVALANPVMVLWPAENATDIAPAFFAEEPDPLPDYGVSGYPISVQFNSARLHSWSVTALRLFDLATNSYVTDTRFLDRATDPNKMLRDNEFVLFPLTRLEWARRYRVELEYVADHVPRFKTWTFSTRDPGVAITQVTAEDSTVAISNYSTSYLYFPPANPFQSLTAYRYTYPRSAALSFSPVDHNTITVSVHAAPGDRIVMAFEDGRVLTLVVQP